MKRVLLAVVCDEAHAAMLARHPDFRVVYAAPGGTERAVLVPAPQTAEGGNVTSPLLLPMPEVAAALHLSERKVRELVASGELPAVSVGRARRVRVTDLAAYVERLGQPIQESA